MNPFNLIALMAAMVATAMACDPNIPCTIDFDRPTGNDCSCCCSGSCYTQCDLEKPDGSCEPGWDYPACNPK
ncbi:unnamed protein product [Cercospora beticola]|nr:unnamed protein product [Cercospora beticola]